MSNQATLTNTSVKIIGASAALTTTYGQASIGATGTNFDISSTGTGGGTVTIGSIGTGNVTVGNSTLGTTTINSSTVSIQSTDSTGGTINIKNGASSSGDINIKSGLTSAGNVNIFNNTDSGGDLNIKNGTSASGQVNIANNSGSVLTNIGAGTGTGTIAIGNPLNITDLKSGTMNIQNVATTGGDVNIKSNSTSSGNVNIKNGTSASGQVNIASSTGTVTTNIGAGTVSGLITIGNPSNQTDIKSGTTTVSRNAVGVKNTYVEVLSSYNNNIIRFHSSGAYDTTSDSRITAYGGSTGAEQGTLEFTAKSILLTGSTTSFSSPITLGSAPSTSPGVSLATATSLQSSYLGSVLYVPTSYWNPTTSLVNGNFVFTTNPTLPVGGVYLFVLNFFADFTTGVLPVGGQINVGGAGIPGTPSTVINLSNSGTQTVGNGSIVVFGTASAYTFTYFCVSSGTNLKINTAISSLQIIRIA